MERKLLNKLVTRLRFKGALDGLSDKRFVELMYYARFGKCLNLKEPETFNEKLQWLKLYYRNPLYSRLVDKYEVKEYVAEVLGREYIIPALGVWDQAADIDFDKLPERFVLKCTHDCHSVIICKDKKNFDIEAARQRLSRALKRSYYKTGREWPYKTVKPRILAEKYMEDESGELQDYKVHCFNGVPQFILVCSNRFGEEGLREEFYSADWELMDMQRPGARSETIHERPEKLDDMLELSKLLAQDFPFVRTDFYIINNKIYFGEMTFFPASGFKAFEPEGWDRKLGDLLVLPKTPEYQ